ncbi:MAG: hypothetical protein GY803_00490 [Chloroflexi bacterium]|nr:hypothetical protein [Chloroflexota bacterium]
MAERMASSPGRLARFCRLNWRDDAETAPGALPFVSIQAVPHRPAPTYHEYETSHFWHTASWAGVGAEFAGGVGGVGAGHHSGGGAAGRE